MSMNGIDISNHQAGLDLSLVPCDFVICKATEGTTFVDRYCDGFVQQAIALGKPFGVYHFASGRSSGRAEAEFFYNNVKGYVGKGILVLDWEGSAVNRGVGYAKEFLDRLYELTGVKALLYTYNNCVNSYDWSSVVAADYGLWNAGYYAGYQTMGYNPNAPLKGGTGAWIGAAMYQYTSSGRLPGYGGNLDLDVFYGNGEAWKRYASPGQSAGGWVKDEKGWWYKRADGSYPRNEWLHLDSWYWFDAEGYAVTGWQLIGGRWYYFNADCRMLTGWRLIDDHWYYLSSNGDMLTGWQLIGGKWYYLTPEKQKDKDHPHGSMQSGFVEDGGRYTYYCIPKSEGSPEGAMITGWKQIDGDWYYLNEGKECQPLGSMMRNHWLGKYYLKDDGKMAKSETLEIGGKEYKFDPDGRVI